MLKPFEILNNGKQKAMNLLNNRPQGAMKGMGNNPKSNPKIQDNKGSKNIASIQGATKSDATAPKTDKGFQRLIKQ